MIILGAGMAGCLAGVLNPNSRIHESAAGITNVHRAVLRFRSDAVSKQTGIPFQKVRVHKAIWYEGAERSCTPRLANLYAAKVTGVYLADRSIWNMDPVDRWIAPHNFHQLLAHSCDDRIIFDSHVRDIKHWERPIISTLPMHVLADIIGVKPPFDFNFKSIFINRFEVENCDVHATIYFPDNKLSLYRATLTGNNLILESTSVDFYDVSIALRAFGIDDATMKQTSRGHEQRHGKIAPIPEAWRKEFILRATLDHGIFSLGRYATWRNILIDDVLEDIYVIRRLIDQSKYNITLELS